MGWVGNAIETMRAARRKGVWPLVASGVLAALVGLYLRSRRRRERDPDHQRVADYAAGRTLWTEALKAHLDAAKVFVLLVPAIAAVTITLLADVFDPSSVDIPLLLYLGWGALAVSWLAALLMLYLGRQVAYSAGHHLIYKHVDPKLSDSELERSHRKAGRATLSMVLMYLSAVAGLGLVASFVGVNIGGGETEATAAATPTATATATAIASPAASPTPSTDGAARYEVTVRFNTSVTQDDIDEVGALLRAYDDELEYVIMESWPPVGRALLTTDVAEFCETVEAELEAKSYIDEVSCGPA